jgi:hypothetical protein
MELRCRGSGEMEDFAGMLLGGKALEYRRLLVTLIRCLPHSGKAP